MNQNSEDSNLNKGIKKTKKPSFKTLNSIYCEIISTDHTENPVPTLQEENKTGVLSKGFFRLEDNSKNFSNQGFSSRFDNKNLSFSSLKSAMECIIEQVLAKDKFNLTELQEFVNNLPENLTEDDACKIVLKFYTTFGKLKDPLLLTRRLNQAFQDQEKLTEDSVDLIVLKYFYSALEKLPSHSGKCVRAIDLNETGRKIYEKGSIINWKFFNSSSKGEKPIPPFDQRNTYLYLSSLTGRDMPDEGEVLFPPGCNFLVTEKKIEGEKTHIYMEQVGVVFTENIVFWVGDVTSNDEKTFLSKLYHQIYKYHLRIIEKPNAKEAIKEIEENLNGYISRSKSFQIIVKSTIVQEDTDNDILACVKKIMNEGGGKACYCLKQEGDNTDILKNKDYLIVESYKNLMEDLQAKFIYKEQQFFNNEDENGLNYESYENSNSPRHDVDLNTPSLTSESSVQYEQNASTQFLQDKLAQTGDMNTWVTSEQDKNIPKQHSYLESTSQFPLSQKLE